MCNSSFMLSVYVFSLSPESPLTSHATNYFLAVVLSNFFICTLKIILPSSKLPAGYPVLLLFFRMLIYFGQLLQWFCGTNEIQFAFNSHLMQSWSWHSMNYRRKIKITKICFNSRAPWWNAKMCAGHRKFLYYNNGYG